MKKIATVVFFALFLFGPRACEKYEILPPVIVEEVKFTDIQNIFTNKCAACHDGVTADPVLTEGNAYNNLTSGQYIDIANPEESTLYVKMKSSSHSLYSSSGDRSKVLQWIQDGAPNN